MSKTITYIFLGLIILLASFLRFYKLDQIPASLNWDEVAAGYNAYTIANWGADEYGNSLPMIFTSFQDDKHPVHIYITAVLVRIFGLSDYVTRSGGALMGVMSVIAIFFLAREIFKNDLATLLSSLFLAVSPYSIHFSRGLWENNFALSLLIIGLTIFYTGIRKNNWLTALSFIFFGLSFFSYHSAKIVVPFVVLAVCLFNIKKLFSNKYTLVVSTLITLFFGMLVFAEPKILGFARIDQTKFSDEQIANAGGKFNLILDNYKKHFTYAYLFEKGDQGPRASVKIIGEFYKIDLLLSVLGLIFLIYRRKWEALTIVLLWLFLSPIPSSVSSIEPSAIRGIFMVAPILLLSSFGASSVVLLSKNKVLQAISLLIILVFLGKEVLNYLNYYSKVYPVKEAIEWQYGMKEMVNYSVEDKNIYKMYVDNIRQQPYIFFLYFLKTPLPEFLKTVRYEETEAKSFSTVRSFGKYQFGGWNIIDSFPNEGIYYAVTPSYYTGLRYAAQFDVAKLIKYPDNNNAFYIINGHQ